MGPQSSELEVEKDSEEKVKGRDNNSRLAAVKGFLHKLGRNEMQSSHLYLRCKPGANSSPMYLLKLQNYEQHKY